MYRFATLALLVPTLMAVDCDPAPPEPVEAFPCESTFDWEDPGHPKIVNLYAWNGAEYIGVDRGCCDMFYEIYDTATCTFVCAPEGGLTGQGDGNCPTFYDDATFLETVYTE